MEEKFQAVLLGLAVGDALGGPLQFMSNNQIQIRHGMVDSMLGGGWLGLRRGEYTGNTKRMMALLENLLENKALDRDKLAQQYLRWYRTNPQDMKPVTRTALSLLQSGEHPNNVAEKAFDEVTGESDDGEPLPAIVPLVLLYLHDPEKLAAETRKAVELTHYDKKVISGAVILNLTICRILNGENDQKMIRSQVQTIIDEILLYDIIPDIKGKKKEELINNPRVQDILESAWWCVWKSKNFQEALVHSINLGDESSIAGAVTGALAGARYGLAGIPEKWLSHLEDKNIIASFARRLYKM